MPSPCGKIGLHYRPHVTMHIDPETFLQVIRSTPLVSIDLVVRNPAQQVLLGYRTNRPARDSWFVPGGRIRKNELVRDALQRIIRVELGIDAARVAASAQLIGVFDHLYEDNALDAPDTGTHYVVCACSLRIEEQDLQDLQPDAQHTQLRWWNVAELLRSPEVHDNTKRYFLETANQGFRCTAR